jgi:hypothetical protein
MWLHMYIGLGKESIIEGMVTLLITDVAGFIQVGTKWRQMQTAVCKCVSCFVYPALLKGGT